MIDYFIIAVLYTVVDIVLLIVGNVPKNLRGKQGLSFIVSFVMVLLAIFLLKVIILPITRIAGWVLAVFSITILPGSAFAYIIYALTIILLISIIRIIIRYTIIRKYFEKIQSILSFIIWPYEKEADNSYVLKSKWSFLKHLAKASMVISAGLYVLLLTMGLLLPSGLTMPLLLPFVVFIILEIFFYLDGLEPALHPDQVSGDEARFTKILNYTRLWEDYQKIWSDKVLFAACFNIPLKKESAAPDLKTMQGKLLHSKGYDVDKFDDLLIHYALPEKKDLIISNPAYDRFAPVLSSIITHNVTVGGHVMILLPIENSHIQNSNYGEDFRGWLDAWMRKLNGDQNIWNVQYFNKLFESDPDIKSSIIVTTSDQLLDFRTFNNTWFDSLSLIVVFQTLDDFQANLAENNALLKIIDNQKKSIQTIVLSDERMNLQEAVERNLDWRTNKSELSYLFEDPSESTFTIIWKAEGDPTYDLKILAGDSFEFFDVQSVLALLSVRDFVDHVELINVNKLSWEETAEEILRKREHLVKTITERTIIEYYREKVKIPVLADLIKREDFKIVFVRDTDNNALITYKKWHSFGIKNSFVHVISPPYLLRDYLIDNFEFFHKSPLYPLCPKLYQGDFNLSMEILYKLMIKPVSSDEITALARKVMNHREIISPFELLSGIFESSFKIDSKTISAYLRSEERSDYILENGNGFFKEYQLFSLNESITREVKNLWFLRRVKVIDSSGNLIKEVDYDRMYQDYLPGQIHSFIGRPYKIRNFDEKAFILNVEFTPPERYFLFYRNSSELDIEDLTDLRKEGTESFMRTISNCHYRVRTNGYYTFYNEYSRKDKNCSFFRVDKIPDREYPNGRAVVYEFNPDPSTLDSAYEVHATLILLLKELLRSIFPGHHNYLFVGSIGMDYPKEYEFLYTKINETEGSRHKRDRDYGADSIKIVVLEDAVQDLGIVNTLFDNYEYVLKILGDYLAWLTNPAEISQAMGTLFKSSVRKFPQTSKDTFLKFGDESLPSFLNPGKTLQLISTVLKKNELTEQRTRFYSGEIGADLQDSTRSVCDFCGRETESDALEVHQDGRNRCSKCKESAIDTVEELEKTYILGKELFEKTFSLSLPVGISVKFTDAATLNQNIGKSFEPTAGFDPRVVGFATHTEVEFVIFIENGAPAVNTLETIVHELTHIWQINQLDMAKLEEETGNILIEGHAVWSSIQILRKNGYEFEANILDQHFMKRQDEYGVGYRLILQRCIKIDPFKYLLKFYSKK